MAENIGKAAAGLTEIRRIAADLPEEAIAVDQSKFAIEDSNAKCQRVQAVLDQREHVQGRGRRLPPGGANVLHNVGGPLMP